MAELILILKDLSKELTLFQVATLRLYYYRNPHPSLSFLKSWHWEMTQVERAGCWCPPKAGNRSWLTAEAGSGALPDGPLAAASGVGEHRRSWGAPAGCCGGAEPSSSCTSSEHLWDVVLAAAISRAGWEGCMQITVPGGSLSVFKYVFRVSSFCFFLSLVYGFSSSSMYLSQRFV